MDCIDLKERFGKKYKITKEFGISDDPWNLQIPCRHGHICPWGGEDLAACTNRRGKLPDRLKEAGAWIAQDGDDGVNAVFPVSRFLEIAKIMRPRRRKQISETEHKRLSEIGQKGRLFSKTHGCK